jgi:hypothetical protein
VLWSSIVAVATVNLFNFMFSALVILYVVDNLGISPGLLGAVLGAASVGALLGSLLTGRLVRAIGVGPSYLVGLIAFPLPLLLVPAAGGPRWWWRSCSCPNSRPGRGDGARHHVARCGRADPTQAARPRPAPPDAQLRHPADRGAIGGALAPPSASARRWIATGGAPARCG